MTISEAVSLVVQASTMSEGSEISFWTWANPSASWISAENMIRLAGKVPYEDIDIQFTGLRPGRKADRGDQRTRAMACCPLPWKRCT